MGLCSAVVLLFAGSTAIAGFNATHWLAALGGVSDPTQGLLGSIDGGFVAVTLVGRLPGSRRIS